MRSKKEWAFWRKLILSWFAVSSIFCILLDLFLSTIQPDKGMRWAENFDLSFISQCIYVSVWCTCSIAIWAIANLLNYRFNVAHWLVGRDNDNFIVSLSVIVFFVYFFSLVCNPAGIVGFDIWYKDLKSSIEHFINPILLLITYFVFIKYRVNEKQYAKKDGWFPLIFISVWLTIVLVREAMLVEFDPTFAPMKHGHVVNNEIPAFPYTAVDPFTTSPEMWIPALIGIEFGTYGVCNFFNWAGNIAYDHNKKFNGYIDWAKVSEDDFTKRKALKAEQHANRNRFE